MYRLALLLAALPLCAQFTSNINVGGGAIPNYAVDTACGGTAYAVAGQPGPFATMKYSATSFSCTVPAPLGTCTATALLIENRPNGPDPAMQSSSGTRVFSITVNGLSINGIDLWARVGALQPYRLPLPTATVTDGFLHITVTASKGNAVLSGLEIACTLQPPLPFTYDATTGWHFGGMLHIDGNLIISGTEGTGATGQPSVFTITQQDGSTCSLTFAGGKMLLTCP